LISKLSIVHMENKSDFEENEFEDDFDDDLDETSDED
jgi:hypothetical protein